MNDIPILIPARGGSVRIPHKNIVDLCERPLLSYVINESLKVTDDVYVSTENADIKKVAQTYGAKVIDRPHELATDTISVNPTVEHFIGLLDVSKFILVQPTSPLLKAKYIFETIKMMSTQEYDSIISVYEEQGFYWNKHGVPLNFDINNKPRTQDVAGWYAENGAIFSTTTGNFLKNKNLVNGRVGFVVMPKLLSIDIDTYKDLFLAECILRNQESNLLLD